MSVPYLLNERLATLEPLLLIGDDVLVVGSADFPVGTLVSRMGVAHPLKQLSSMRGLMNRHGHLLKAELRSAVEARLKRWLGEDSGSALAYFISVLGPLIEERDWSESSLRARGPVSLGNVDTAGLLAIVSNPPDGPPPRPSLVARGRLWLLAESGPRTHAIRIVMGDRAFVTTGHSIPVWELERRWNRAVEQFLGGCCDHLVAQVQRGQGEIAVASREFRQRGALTIGDLILIDTGTVPRLGYLLPGHYNRSLRHLCSRDVAITAPLMLPPLVHDLQVYRQTPHGRWTRASLPHGLCLGSRPGRRSFEEPGLELVADLRWAAVRVAANGRFHEGD